MGDAYLYSDNSDESPFLSNISNIYNQYKPQFANRFEVLVYELFSTGNSGLSNASNMSRFLAKSISLDGESLSLERHSGTKQFTLSGSPYQWADNITITWDETESWLVHKYHENWLRAFYHKETDQYQSGLDGKYKIFDIHYPLSDGSTKVLRFWKVLPTNLSQLQYQWSSSPSVTSLSLTYKVTSWGWLSMNGTSLISDSGTTFNTSNKGTLDGLTFEAPKGGYKIY